MSLLNRTRGYLRRTLFLTKHTLITAVRLPLTHYVADLSHAVGTFTLKVPPLVIVEKLYKYLIGLQKFFFIGLVI